MFRKVKKKAGKPKKRVIEEDEDDNDQNAEDDAETSLHEKIRQTQKKQKILASMPLATGKGGTGRITGTTAITSTHTDDQQQQQQQDQSVSVLASKHKSAMEEFIEKQIEASTPRAKAPKRDFEDNDDSGHISLVNNEEEDLYQQLSREAYTGGHLTSQSHPKDDDKGAGGAMLVGSGIAEVILPTDRRLAGAAAWNAHEQPGVIKNRRNAVGSSSSAVPVGSTEALPLTTPAPFGRSMVTQHGHVPREPPHVQAPSDTKNGDNDPASSAGGGTQKNGATAGASAAAPTTPDGGRLGFDAIRGRLSGSTPTTFTSNHTGDKNKHFQKNRDDQVFSNFVKREMEGNRR
jgi:hypothetical protein